MAALRDAVRQLAIKLPNVEKYCDWQKLLDASPEELEALTRELVHLRLLAKKKGEPR